MDLPLKVFVVQPLEGMPVVHSLKKGTLELKKGNVDLE